MKKQNKAKAKREASEKIKFLFGEAKKNLKKATPFVAKARKIGMKVNLPLAKEYKIKYCKHCNTYFTSGNYRVRTRNNMVVYSCLTCKKYMKFKLS